MLGTGLRFFARAGSACNHLAISLGPGFGFEVHHTALCDGCAKFTVPYRISDFLCLSILPAFVYFFHNGHSYWGTVKKALIGFSDVATIFNI